MFALVDNDGYNFHNFNNEILKVVQIYEMETRLKMHRMLKCIDLYMRGKMHIVVQDAAKFIGNIRPEIVFKEKKRCS